MFTNAKEVRINNKLVKSIKSVDGNMTLYINAYLKTGDISLMGDKKIIQTNETVNLQGVLMSGDSDVPIYFYELYEPFDLSLNGDRSIMQSGDVLKLTSKLKDEDGSLVEGENIYYYAELDKINDNGIEYSMTGGNKILYRISNLGTKWKLSCQLKSTAEARLFIGDANNTDSNPKNSVFIGSPNGTNLAYYGSRLTSTSATDISNYDVTQYTAMSIERNGNIFTFTLNGTSYTRDISWFNFTDLVLGLVAWGSGTIYVKYLKLEEVQ